VARALARTEHPRWTGFDGRHAHPYRDIPASLTRVKYR
jgi:hypothetical protein